MFRSVLLLCWAALGLSACAHEIAAPTVAGAPAAECEAYEAADRPPPDTVFSPSEARTAASPDRAPRCDVSAMTVAVRRQGQFRTVYGSKDTEISAPKAIDPVFARLAGAPAGEPLKILIYAHGGLVQHKGAVEGVEELAPAMLADGFQPVFLIWNSDFETAYRDRLCCVRDGRRNTAGNIYFAPARLIGDVGASIPRSLETFGRQAFRWRQTGPFKDERSRYVLTGKERDQVLESVEGEPKPLIIYPVHDKTSPESINRTLNGDAPDAARQVRYLAGLPVRAAVTAVAPEVGARAWDNMVRKTRLAFEGAPYEGGGEKLAAVSCAARSAQRKRENVLFRNEEERGGFAVFFDRLQCELDHGALKDRHVEIEMYGHSMGAIVANEAIWRYPTLPWKRVVHMAAANTIRDFRLTTAPILERCGIDFHSHMLHPLNEGREINAFGMVPQGSLLEWIDEMFEGPRSIDDRTSGKWLNMQRAMRLFPSGQLQQMTFRVFPRDDRRVPPSGACSWAPGVRQGLVRCHPVTHGGANDYTFWREAYLTGGGDLSSQQLRVRPAVARSDSRKVGCRAVRPEPPAR